MKTASTRAVALARRLMLVSALFALAIYGLAVSRPAPAQPGAPSIVAGNLNDPPVLLSFYGAPVNATSKARATDPQCVLVDVANAASDLGPANSSPGTMYTVATAQGDMTKPAKGHFKNAVVRVQLVNAPCPASRMPKAH